HPPPGDALDVLAVGDDGDVVAAGVRRPGDVAPHLVLAELGLGRLRHLDADADGAEQVGRLGHLGEVARLDLADVERQVGADLVPGAGRVDDARRAPVAEGGADVRAAVGRVAAGRPGVGVEAGRRRVVGQNGGIVEGRRLARDGAREEMFVGRAGPYAVAPWSFPSMPQPPCGTTLSYPQSSG